MNYAEKYSIDSVQDIVDENLPGYNVLDIKRESDGTKYGHKWKVLLKCPNVNHRPYWTSLNVIKAKHPCRKCIEDPEFLTQRKKNIVLQACKKNNCRFIEVVPSNKKRFQSIVIKIEDQDGLWYNVTLDHLRNRQMHYNVRFTEANPYAVHNIVTWCSKYRPDYQFCSESVTSSDSKYWFKYTGNELDLEECDRYFYMSLCNFLYEGGGHPLLRKVRKTYGEWLIRSYLKEHDYGFSEQQTFPDLLSRRGAHLFFDFYLPDQNIVIEVDGVQHFEPVEHFGGEKSFSRLQDNDTIKNDFCEKNHIRLLRIPYYLYGSKKEPNNEYLIILQKLFLTGGK